MMESRVQPQPRLESAPAAMAWLQRSSTTRTCYYYWHGWPLRCRCRCPPPPPGDLAGACPARPAAPPGDPVRLKSGYSF